mmetsp:Transcript_15475/g.32361  ORF Transcript_15475/g.32361 Transcript_15475/m.32361 type:complete len:436 (-) Transcript_15475:84-1391(-)
MLIMLTPEHLKTLENLTDADEESLKSLATACSTSDATNGRTKIDMINDILAAMLAPTGDWDTAATPAELRAIVDQRGLPISKQIGGRTKRTKQEMLAEVVTHLAQAAEANALQADAEAKALSLRLADEAAAAANMITTMAPFTPNRIRRQSSPTSSSKPDSPLSVAELELLLSPPEERKIEEYKALCEKLGLDANKLCQTGTPAGWTKVDVASRILVSVAEREERAGSLRGEHKALCELVAKHRLQVNTITGLKDRRTNEDIASDILRRTTTPEYKAHRVQSYTTGPTKTATTTTEPLDPVRANLTNLFDQAGNEEQKAEEDPGVVLDVHPPPTAAVVTAGNTVYRFVLGFVLCVLCMGLCLTCVVAGNDLWKTLARFSLDSFGTRRDVAGAILENAFRSGIPGGPLIFLQGLQSIDLHAPALKLPSESHVARLL